MDAEMDPSLEAPPVENVVVEEAAGEVLGSAEPVEPNDDEEADAKPKRAPRKRKRRALDSHFAGMSEEEIAAFKESVLGELGIQSTPGPGTDEGAVEGSPEPEDTLEEVVPSNRLAPEVIEARRRVLRTDWRMAAFSQFSIAFPHLCLRDFEIGKLEQDLEGSYPGSYVGEVISRLMYTLTRDSRLAGDDTKEKPWLVRLRREFVRRDSEHNKLGDGPLSIEEFWEDDDIPRGPASTSYGNGDTADLKPDIAGPVAEADAGLSDVPSAQPAPSTGGAQIMTGAVVNGEGIDAKPTGMSIDQRPLLPTEWTTSYGWEDLTISEQVYALWSITEWHLQNADKFRNALTKSRVTEEEHVTWRIEPIGRDSENSVYWLFDDNRLWIERETPLKRELRFVYEEAQAKVAERRRLREKRIRRQQKQRMHALHERRRQRTLAKKAAEERLDREIEEIDARQRAEGSSGPNGRSKRKRAESEDEEAEVANLRSSSRVGHARLAERMASRPPRRKSMRTGSSSDLKPGSSSNSLMQVDGEEDWQKIPAEWLKSENQEKDEDPDFGAAGDGQVADEGDESESDLSILDDEEEAALKAEMPGRTSQRRSPRKVVGFEGDGEREDLSDLSDLSEGRGDMSGDEGDPVSSSLSNEVFPESAYNLGPSFDDEDKDLPEGFVRFEAICTNMEEWLALDDRFGDTEDVKELTLLAFVKEKIIPGVQADYEAREREKQRQEAARKAAEKKRRVAEKAARNASLEAASAPAASTSKNQNSHGTRTRSSRIVKKELTEEEKRQKALNERVNYNEKAMFAGTGGNNTRDGSEALDTKAIEVDRRALRAKQREDEKRAREEAEMMQELQEAKEEPQDDMAMQDVPVQVAPLDAPQLAMELDAAPAPAPASATYQPPAPLQDIAMAEEPQQVYDESVPFEMVEDNDYRLDCSVCRRRGMNLDSNQRLVQCDHCDRWEHVTCHRKAAEKAGLPKPDFDNDPFVCEDCQVLDESVIIVPAAAKRARSDKQMEGARKGAEKRRAKFEARRIKNGTASKGAEGGGVQASGTPGPSSAPTPPPVSAVKTLPTKPKTTPKPRAEPKPKPAKLETPKSTGSRKSGRKSAGTGSEEPTFAERSMIVGQASGADVPSGSMTSYSTATLPSGPSFQLNGSSQAISTSFPSNTSHAGSDIPIDPNLASRQATPMSRQSTESMVPLPSFLNTMASSSSLPYQTMPTYSSEIPIQPSTGSTASLADIAIPGIQQQNTTLQPIPAESAQSSADAALSAYIAQIEQNQYQNPDIDPLLAGTAELP